MRVCSASSTELRATCTCSSAAGYIQQGGADLVFYLAAQIFQPGAVLPERGLGLQNVGVNLAALEDGNIQPARNRKRTVRVPGLIPRSP